MGFIREIRKPDLRMEEFLRNTYRNKEQQKLSEQPELQAYGSSEVLYLGYYILVGIFFLVYCCSVL